MQILSHMCKIDNETAATQLSIWRPVQHNYRSRDTPNPQQQAWAKSFFWSREGRLWQTSVSKQKPIPSLSLYFLTALGLPSSIYLDMFTCTQRFVEGIGFGPVFMLSFTLGVLAAANPSTCTKMWPVLALVTQLSCSCQNTPRTPLGHPQALKPWRSFG